MTELRLTSGEFWLLETAVEASVMIHLLSSEPGEDGIGCDVFTFNKRSHGLPLAQLAETLKRLAEWEFIEFFHRDDPTTNLFSWSLGEISQWLKPSDWNSKSMDLRYRLTQSGGAAWEDFACPKWDWFLRGPRPRNGSDAGAEIVSESARAANRDCLERYLTYFDAICGKLIEETVRFEESSPFKATYWKTLPSGWSVQFCYHPRKVIERTESRRFLDWEDFRGREAYANELQDWGLQSFLDGWYSLGDWESNPTPDP